MFEHGYALLIGVDQSKMPNLALPIVKKDVTRLADVILHPERCGYVEGHVRVLTGPDATRANILDGLDWLKQSLESDADPNQTALIYYSGHGHREEDFGESFLIPYDIRRPLRVGAISARDFAESIDAIRPRRLVVILDCCHAESLEVKDTTATGLSPTAVTPESSGVEVLAQGDGRAVLSSSRGTQKSWIRTDGQMSVFTYHLIEALTGYTERPDHPDVTITEVMEYVARTVPVTAEMQHAANQEPVFRFSGAAFPIARVLGGKGLQKGEAAPNPLDPLPRVDASLKADEVEGKATVADVEQMTGGDLRATAEIKKIAQTGDATVIRIKKLGR